MKKILFIMALAANVCAQNCDTFTTVHTDKVSGTSYKMMAESIIVSKDYKTSGLNITMLNGSKSVILSIVAVGSSRCIEKSSKINILFTDGTRMELVTDGDFNCKNTATIYFGCVFGKKTQREELCTKDIDIMRVWTSAGYVEEKFSADQANKFKNSLKCLSTQ
jgi:hypothetical protein